MFSFQKLTFTSSNNNSMMSGSGSSNSANAGNYSRCSEILEFIHSHHQKLKTTSSSTTNNTVDQEVNQPLIHKIQNVAGHLALHLFGGKLIIGLDNIPSKQNNYAQLYTTLIDLLQKRDFSIFNSQNSNQLLSPMLCCFEKDGFVYSGFEIKDEVSEQSSGFNFGTSFIKDLTVIRFITINRSGQVVVWRYHEDSTAWKVENTFNIIGGSTSLKIEYATVLNSSRTIIFKTTSSLTGSENMLNIYSTNNGNSSFTYSKNRSDDTIRHIIESKHSSSATNIIIITKLNIYLFDIKNKKEVSHLKNIKKFSESEKVDPSTVYYVSLLIHPITKELILVDSSLSITIYSHNLNSNKKLNIKANQTRNLSKVQSCLIHNTFLALYDSSNNMSIYDLYSGSLLSTVMIPSDLTFNEKSAIVTLLGNGCLNNESSMIDQSFTLYIFGKSLIYELKCPPLTEIIKATSLLSNQCPNYNHLLKEFKLFHIYSKNILEDLHNNANNKVSTDVKQSISHNLENPALVWTSCNTLLDQSQNLKQVEQFIDNYPSLNSSFWKNSINNGHQNENDNTQNSTSLHQLFSKTTPLNMSIIPPLYQSSSICKDQISNLDISKGFPRLSTLPENDTDFDNLTDIELYEMIDSDPFKLLHHLFKVCDLQALKSIIDKGVNITENYPNIYGLAIPSMESIKPITTLMNFYEQNYEDPINPIDLYRVEENRNEDYVVYQNKVFSSLEPKRSANHTRKGLLYIEILIKTLFFHCEYPQTILIIIIMMEDYKLKQLNIRKEQVKQEIESISKKKSSNSSSNLTATAKNYQLEQFNLQNLQTEYQEINARLKNSLKQKYSKEIQNIIDFNQEDTPFSEIQLKTLAQLYLWQGNRMYALKLYITHNIEEQIIKLVSSYYLNQQGNIPIEEQYQVLNLIFGYCLSPVKCSPSTKETLMSYGWQMMPLSYSVFDFFSKYRSNRLPFDSSDKVFITHETSDDLGQSVEQYMQGLKSFTNMKLKLATQMK